MQESRLSLSEKTSGKKLVFIFQQKGLNAENITFYCNMKSALYHDFINRKFFFVFKILSVKKFKKMKNVITIYWSSKSHILEVIKHRFYCLL
jgi:hypothetical protein